MDFPTHRPILSKISPPARSVDPARARDEPVGQVSGPRPELSVGAAAQELRKTIGLPDSISSDGTQWTYGSRVVLLRDEKVVGWIDVDKPRPPAAASDDRPARRLEAANRPTHVGATSRDGGGPRRARVVWADSMGRSKGGPWVFGSIRSGRNAGRLRRGLDGSRDLAHTEYGRRTARN